MKTVGLVVVSLALVPSAVGLTSSRPSLRAVSERPLVVRGESFVAGERVVVRAIGRTVRSVATVAGPAGTFRVRVARPAPMYCGQIVVRAIGSRGSSALLRLGSPECNEVGEGR